VYEPCTIICHVSIITIEMTDYHCYSFVIVFCNFLLLGDSNVGKTSIFLRYIREQFDYSYQPTMNVNIGNVTKKVQFPFETLVSVSLWDLPGREEIDLRRSYYKDIDAAVGKIIFNQSNSLLLKFWF